MVDVCLFVLVLVMGVEGMNMGIWFIVIKEVFVYENVKQVFVVVFEFDICFVMCFLCNMECVLNNVVVEVFFEKEKSLGVDFKFEDILLEVVGVYLKIMIDGNMDVGVWSCGMVVGLIYDIFIV